MKPSENRGNSRTFEQIYQKTYINYDGNGISRSAEQPEKMLIIANDDLIPELDALVTWKRQMGIHTTVVPLSQIGSSASAEIYNFVKQYYTDEGITYLLLVGDENAIDPEMRQDGDFYACDNCFGYMDGTDHYLDVLVGRFHASTPEQARIMVNRNVGSEKTPVAEDGNNWFATGMWSASNQGQGIGDDNQADYEQANAWKAEQLADGYDKFWEFYDGDHSDISPTPGNPAPMNPAIPPMHRWSA